MLVQICAGQNKCNNQEHYCWVESVSRPGGGCLLLSSLKTSLSWSWLSIAVQRQCYRKYLLVNCDALYCGIGSTYPSLIWKNEFVSTCWFLGGARQCCYLEIIFPEACSPAAWISAVSTKWHLLLCSSQLCRISNGDRDILQQLCREPRLYSMQPTWTSASRKQNSQLDRILSEKTDARMLRQISSPHRHYYSPTCFCRYTYTRLGVT